MCDPNQNHLSHKLVKATTRLHQDEIIPLVVSTETFASLHRLWSKCQRQNETLRRFLVGVDSFQIADALLHLLLPARFQQLCEELEARDIEKEDAVANGDFERAGELRRRTDQIKTELRGFPEVAVTPDHVIQALRTLGYTGPVP